MHVRPFAQRAGVERFNRAWHGGGFRSGVRVCVAYCPTYREILLSPEGRERACSRHYCIDGHAWDASISSGNEEMMSQPTFKNAGIVTGNTRAFPSERVNPNETASSEVLRGQPVHSGSRGVAASLPRTDSRHYVSADMATVAVDWTSIEPSAGFLLDDAPRSLRAK